MPIADVLTFLLLAAFFSLLAVYAKVDRDEGFYLYSAELISKGMAPYSQFFLPQMPLMEYLLAVWGWIFDWNWYSARFFAASWSVAIAIALFYFLKAGRRGTVFAYLGLLLYVTLFQTVFFFPQVKTFSLSAFLILAPCLLLIRPPRKLIKSRWALSGLLVGLAIATRPYLGILVPVFLYYILFCLRSSKKEKKRRVVLFAKFLLLSLLPVAIFPFFDFTNFTFGILRFHSIRSDLGLVGGFLQKYDVFLALFSTESAWGMGWGWSKFYLNTFTILSIFTVYSGLSAAYRSRRLSLLYLVILSVFLVCFLPSPAWTEYFSIIPPLQVCACIAYIQNVKYQQCRWRLIRTVVVSWLSIVSLYHLPSLLTWIFSYSADRHDTIWDVDRISKEITSNSQPSDTIITFWSGYLVGTNRNTMPGLENHCALNEGATARLTPSERALFHLADKEELESAISKKPSVLLVTGDEEQFDIIPCPALFTEISRKPNCQKLKSVMKLTFFRCSRV